MSDAPSTTAEPRITGSPNRPNFVRRRGLFIALLIVYVVWMSALIVMAIQQRR